MKFELYPDFDEVFEDENLRGFFYPLCKVMDFEDDIKSPLFFISTNGLFMDDHFKSPHNSSVYTCFYLHNGKYRFEGDLRLYKGHKAARDVFLMLSDDFKLNGEQYLSQKTKPIKYMDSLKSKMNINFGDLDVNYFFETFYSFSLNKLHFEKTKELSIYNHIINGFVNQERGLESALDFEIPTGNSSGFADIEINKEFLFPSSIDIDQYQKIGYTVGSEFFMDGNDSYLLYDKDNNRVVCINHYS